MANWVDVVVLVITASIFGGIIYGIMAVSKTVDQGVKSTKEALKSKGLDISEHGVKVKTDGRFDREQYVDATQRGMIKAMGAASFGKSTPDGSPVTAPKPLASRQISSTSTTSTSEKEKKKGFFKRAVSGHGKDNQ